MTTITRTYRFCASHRLHSKALSAAENEKIYRKCNNPYGHGHDYSLDVSVVGEVNPVTGLIVRLASLDDLVEQMVLKDFAYRDLNRDVAEFAGLVPTTENVALVIAERLRLAWADNFPYASARLSGISVRETDRNSFEVLLRKENTRVQDEFLDLKESVILNA